MIAPSVLIVIDRPDSVGRTLEIGAIGPPGAHAGLDPAGGHPVHAVEGGEGVEQLAVALGRRVLVVGLLGHQDGRRFTSEARSSATRDGLERVLLPAGGLGLLARGPAAEHQRRVQLRRGGRGDVGVEPVADHQRLALAQAVEGGQEQLRLGLAHQGRGRAAGGLDRGQQRAGARPQAVGHRVGRVAGGGQEVGAPLDGERGGAQVVVGELLGGGHHDHLGARGEVGPVHDLQARPRATWRCIASVPTTNAVRPVRVSASRCCMAPPEVTTSASEACTPTPQSWVT